MGIPSRSGGTIEPRYFNLLSRLPAIVYVADPGAAGRWYYVSPQVEAILGYAPEEWYEDPNLWARVLHPDDRDRVLSVEHAEKDVSRGGALEYRIRRRDGHYVWIRDDAELIRDDDGVRRWHGVLSDISVQRRDARELERRAAQQAAVAGLGEHALEGRGARELMREAVVTVNELLDVDGSGVLELLPDGTLIVRAAMARELASPITPAHGGEMIAIGPRSIASRTIETLEPTVVSDWTIETRFEPDLPLRARGSRSAACVPIQGRGAPFGVLAVESRRPHEFGTAEIAFLQGLANVLADALERQATEDAIRHRALHDPLTGLPNRVLFLDRLTHGLTRAGHTGALLAVLFLDLDRFKHVNDSLGHQVGDELLSAVAPRLAGAVSATDTVARFGGDEFGILLEDLPDERAATETAERIVKVFGRPFTVAATEQYMTTSIGIALARGGGAADGLIRDADAAMYRAKERGGARYELFDAGMRTRTAARRKVETDLRAALSNGDFGLVYQPVVALASSRVVGVEALLRWNRPDARRQGPDEFIPVAEETGLIEPIGRWAVEAACRDAALWARDADTAAAPWISINLSPAQLLRRDFPEQIGEIVHASGLDPARVTFEVTETAVLRDVDTLAESLHELRRIGVRLVLDDFGTGYSSLGYITRLPLAGLKIDRSFVAGLDGRPTRHRDAAIVDAVIAMARALSLEVIAEGVETARQAEELASRGAGFAQGFFFSRPLAPADVPAALRGPEERSADASYG